MRADGKETYVHIGDVIARLFRNGIPVEYLQEEDRDRPRENKDPDHDPMYRPYV